MLRKIITAYKAAFLVQCVLLLAGALILGLALMIVGESPQDRWTGFCIMLGGALFVLMLAGNVALILENNELLRRIADQVDRDEGALMRSDRQPVKRPVQAYERREPTL